jgi:hypothetical protein
MRPELLARCLVAAAWLAIALRPPVEAQSPQPLTVGLLRTDGVVIPFARWSSNVWTTLPQHSPVDRHALGVDRWHLGTANGFRSATAGSVITLLEDSGYDSWGQLTDFSPRRIDGGGYPVPRVGVVLSRPERLVHLRPVEHRDAIGARLRSLIRAELDRQDSATVQRYMPGNTLSGAERTRLPIEIVKLDAARDRVRGERVYFYVAERQYPGCESGQLQGFAVETSGVVRLVSPRFALGDCDGKGRTRMTVHAILPLDEVVYVIGEVAGWEGVTRVLLELTPSGVRQLVPNR